MKNKLLITTALVALSVSGNAHADVTINSDTVLESEYTDNVIISGGNVTTKDSSTVSLNYPDGKNLTVNGGNLSLKDSTIYTFNGNTEISGDAVLNLNNDSDIDTNKLTISGGTINLNKGELRQNNSFTMTGGTINANGQTQIGSVGRDTEKVEDTVTSYAGGTTDISGGVINVKGGVGLGSSANDIYDNGNVIFGTSIKLRGDATLDIKEGATLFAYENYKIDEPDLDNSDLDVVTFGNKATITMNDNTSKINLAGTLSANINGDDRGKIHFQNSGAQIDGDVEAASLIFEDSHTLSQAVSGEIGGLDIMDASDMSIKDALIWFNGIKPNLTPKKQEIAAKIIKEICERLSFLNNVGLDYLTLSRQSGSLSGGEAQRIRLASQIGTGLTGVLYVLDEPSIGLHQRDNNRLIETLERLRDIGNSVIVVEHDEDAIRAADFLIDIGPRAGADGGRIMASGTVKDVLKSDSLTAQYLNGIKKIAVPQKRRKGNGKFVGLKGVRTNNLKNIDVKIPLGLFTCVTGVSGGGKSSLILETLCKALEKEINGSREPAGIYDKLTGAENIDKIINIDQSPIGRTPRSNPATYTGVFTNIRDWFAGLPEAKARGYTASRFSFNVTGGRCEACKGDGVTKIEMHFLPDVYVECDVCKGKRFIREKMDFKYKENSIADVLDMTVDEAYAFFENIPSIKNRLDLLRRVGLGYIKLGQPATTLSGGEAQRIKLSKELSKRATGKTLYILDEPTTGLHFEDINKLLSILQSLVDQGNSLIVIEHNLDVIKTADYIIDIGPEGGDGGGRIIAEGTPEQVAQSDISYTAKFLREKL